MAGTNIAAAKSALIAALKTLPALEGVQVAYSYPGRTVERECIYWGERAAGPASVQAMAGSGRIKREEQPTTSLHIAVTQPGNADTEATDARAAQLGAAVENWLAANKTLGVDGLTLAAVDSIELDGGVDDESALSILTYQITFRSYLT